MSGPTEGGARPPSDRSASERGLRPVVREATAAEIADWDARAVDAPGGHVLQSLAWGEHRARIGVRPRHLVFDDGAPLLVLERPWPVIGGASAYLSRGPNPTAPVELTIARLDAAAGWLASHGVDVVAADPEVPAATGLAGRLRDAGWRPIEELWQSKHRVSRPIEPGEDEAVALAAAAKSTRQRIRGAEAGGIAIVRHDPRSDRRDAGDGFRAPDEPTADALGRFYGWLVATGDRRGFAVGTPAEHLAWWEAAFAAGHLIYLEAVADGEPFAGLILYRHGGRLTTVSSADRAETRRTHPGALHLLRWRALQLAIREGCRELDMGGVDVPGARAEPHEGDPMYGLYQHKRAFGGRWLELAGAHERVARPGRYAAGRVMGRAARLVGRATRSRADR